MATCPAGAQTNGFHWNVRQAGAAGDGQADCTAVFQKLLDEAGAAGGGVVEVPAGRYRINTGLSIPANVTLAGTYRVAPTLQHGPCGNLAGSVLLAYAGRGATNAPPFIRLAGNNAVISGFVITYPEWKQTDVPPVPYPPCVLCEGKENVKVSDCLLLNPYEGIKMVGAARHWIRDITGYPIKRGIYVDECYDIGHIENIHFWPFGVAYSPDNPFCKWVNTEGVAFELARTDWHYVFNTFCFGYGVGYKFSSSAHGQRQRQLPRAGRRLVPAGGGGGAGAAAGPAHLQRRVRGALVQHRRRLPGHRPESGRQGEPGQLLLLGTD